MYKGAFFCCPKIGHEAPVSSYTREAINGVTPEIIKEVPQMGKDKVVLACTECKQRNYNTTKNKKNDPDRLEMKKYCKFCRKHTQHRETK